MLDVGFVVVEALQALERVAPATLDALSAHIVILDAGGRVVAVNRAWRTFNAGGAAAGLTPAGAIGDDYLTLCSGLAPQVAPEANSLADGIRRVIAGDIEEFSLEYSVTASETPAWFSVRVTPLQGERDRSVVVAHENISGRKLAEAARLDVEDRLERRRRCPDEGGDDGDEPREGEPARAPGVGLGEGTCPEAVLAGGPGPGLRPDHGAPSGHRTAAGRS